MDPSHCYNVYICLVSIILDPKNFPTLVTLLCMTYAITRGDAWEVIGPSFTDTNLDNIWMHEIHNHTTHTQTQIHIILTQSTVKLYAI